METMDSKVVIVVVMEGSYWWGMGSSYCRGDGYGMVMVKGVGKASNG